MKQKRVTSLDVARQAGVSRTTVSLVLNKVNDNRIRPETVERVLNAARELGYVPDAAARALASRRTGTVGFLLARPSSLLAGDGHFAALLSGLTGIIRQHGLRLLVDLIDDQHSDEAYLDLVHSGQIDGLILGGAMIQEQDLLENLGPGITGGESLPVVLLGNPAARLASVTVDHTAAARAVTTHLAAQGAGRIALICHDPHASREAAELLLGYRLALEGAGMPFDPSLVRPGRLDPETGSAEMSALLEMDDAPDAVFASADLIALGALSALQEHGVRVPDEMALAGFGDIPLAAYAVPPLTSARVPAEEMGRRAAGLLVELLNSSQPAVRQVVLQAELQVRASTLGDE